MTTQTKWIVGIVILVILAGGWWLYSADREPTETGPIKIGFIFPLSGDAASVGEPARNAAALAVSEINEAGGIDGRPIEAIYEDGMCAAKGGTNAAQKLVNVDGVKYIVGGFCSGETLGAAPTTEAAGVILFSPASSNPDITNSGDYVFRNFPSDSDSGRKMAELAIELGFTRIGILSEITDYAESLRAVFSERFVELGGEIVADESYPQESTDVRTQLTKIKAANPDAFYFNPNSPSLVEFGLRQMNELGLDVQIFTNEVFPSGTAMQNIPEIVEGALYAVPAFDVDAIITKEFLDRYLETYETFGSLPPIYLTTPYDAVFILKEAIEASKDDPDVVRDELYEIENRIGTAGALTIDENGDAVLDFTIKTIRNGEEVDYVAE